jgi:RNA polymerase sigma factor (sigma-70 family)
MSQFLDVSIDPECLAAAASGNQTARRAVYNAAGGPVFRLIRHLVRNRTAAEDVFQDTMVSLFQHLPTYRAEAPFGAWLRRIALNHCWMHLRSPWQRARELLGAEAEATVDPVPAEWADLARAVTQLPAITRAVLWLHDVEGLTHDEIAAGFGRSVSFSKSQLARAHAKLRHQLVGWDTKSAPQERWS